ncbi:MAG TPA: sulfite exporter TauE/SafE family protein [Candidatus Gemmiger avistercoris]|uniref:Probable membrane transporter protein n=1 Tax=Candidatus Gemmiger avistercoris TaxID=2838606 RepID=A0A9D2FI85_9FIRM|nr:sulfite exporter TauE/SafE family protein [uncultured Subdoligranulum sp.]HIZ61293.1 sulfite exporter TauE/SafE family protein [Candidatus Gemmiger avistercoris]
MESILYLCVSFFASIAGAICGIGGGVIIKPVLDMLGLAAVATISFLSGCTVLSMSCYTVGRSILAKDTSVDFRTATPLALGAAIGGVVGKQMFEGIAGLFPNPDTVGAVQSICLAIITIGTFVYTLFKARIHGLHIQNPVFCVVIGLLLGIMSSFLGIGGGPINLVVLFFFFSMDTKTAAQNSLYIILFSQIASLLTTLITGSVPEFTVPVLLLMVAGGIGGGIAGRAINKHIDSRAVDKLFLVLMGVIILISFYNTWRYLSL